jgi:hypothetical protein
MILVKHPSMQDVAAHVLCESIIPAPGEDWVHLTVIWYNIHGHKHYGTPPFMIDDEAQLLKMPTSQYKQWVPYVVNHDS